MASNDYLGSQDGRVDSYHNQYSDPTIPYYEEYALPKNNNKIKHTVMPGFNPIRMPMSRALMMDKQGYKFEDGKWSWEKDNPVKRASVDRTARKTIKILNKKTGREEEIEVFALTDPYDDLQKFLFEDCYLHDPVIKRCLNLEADLVLGTRTMSILDIDEEFTAEQLAAGVKQQRLQKALSPELMESLQTEIGVIDREVGLRTKLKAAMIQAGICGRSVLEKVPNEETEGGYAIPKDIKVLNWKKLGKVYVDAMWKIVAIEYADRPDNEPLLPEEIIHFEIDDFHVSPDTLYHGTSKIQPVASVSEINRLLDEVDLKEVAKSNWSPTTLFNFPMDTSPQVIREFMAAYTPGSAQGTDIPNLVSQVINNEAKVDQLYNLRIENDRRQTRNFGTPNPVVGFENITNRATIDTTLRFYFDTEVRDLRTWLQDTVEPQWYQPMLKALAPELVTPTEVSMNSLSQETRARMAAVQDIQPPPVSGRNLLQRRQLARRNRKPKIKVKLEFEDVSIEPFKEKVDALLALYNQALITPREIMKRLDMPHLTEEIERNIEDKKKQEEQQYKDSIQLQKQSIEAGRARAGQRFQQQAQRAVKTASLTDQIDLNYRIQNQLGQINIANMNREHEAKMQYLEMKRKALADLNARMQEELANQ